MKRLSLVLVAALAALAASAVAGTPQVSVNGKSPQTVKSAKVVRFKDGKATKTVGPKKRRRRFLGIF